MEPEFEYKTLKEDVKKLFDDLKIPKTDENATIFANFMKSKSKEFANLVIDNIKEEFIKE